MQFNYYLDDIAIEAPVGFADLQLSVIRDTEYHGVGFEASTGTIEFYGTAAEYLRTKKEQEGISANVVFRAEVVCNAYQEEENIYTGRVNFGLYKDKCGDSCTVIVGLEEDSCIVVLRNREDQQVDIDSLVAFDKQTPLPDYVMMGEEITLPAQEQLGLIEGSVDQTEEINFNQAIGSDAFIIFRPNYNTQVSNNLATGNLSTDYNNEFYSDDDDFEVTFPTPLSPQFLNEESLKCFDGAVGYNFRMKGSFNITASGPASGESLLSAKIIVCTWDGVGDKRTIVSIQEVTLPYSGVVDGVTIAGTFDETISGTTTLAPGLGLYCFLSFHVSAFLSTYVANVFFEEESDVSISGNRLCQDSTTEYYMIHETLSRVVESITNGCARVKSEYFGRTDSEPFAFAGDGCGSLRMFTSGLKIRKAEKDFFFNSFKKLIDGLNGIDNIGFGLEDDPVLPNRKVVRVEDVDFFYQTDNVILTLAAIPAALSEVQEEMYVSKILIGYKHWEVESINGLDEINSTREYRTGFDNISQPLDITSELVAGAYAIEITRQQSFVDSGGADTSYDNETFIICLNRAGYNTFQVEINEVSESSDVYSPDTKYNLRITPARNMLRWYKSIANGYTNLANPNNKIFFSSGTGNISACVKLLNNAYVDPCVIEAVKLCENQDLFITLFAEAAKAQPIFKPETITFDYPLSVAEYNAVKANPYGVVRYQCGKGEFKDGFIKEIKYQPVSGQATFTLIKKY